MKSAGQVNRPQLNQVCEDALKRTVDIMSGSNYTNRPFNVPGDASLQRTVKAAIEDAMLKDKGQDKPMSELECKRFADSLIVGRIQATLDGEKKCRLAPATMKTPQARCLTARVREYAQRNLPITYDKVEHPFMRGTRPDQRSFIAYAAERARLGVQIEADDIDLPAELVKYIKEMKELIKDPKAAKDFENLLRHLFRQAMAHVSGPREKERPAAALKVAPQIIKKIEPFVQAHADAPDASGKEKALDKARMIYVSKVGPKEEYPVTFGMTPDVLFDPVRLGLPPGTKLSPETKAEIRRIYGDALVKFYDNNGKEEPPISVAEKTVDAIKGLGAKTEDELLDKLQPVAVSDVKVDKPNARGEKPATEVVLGQRESARAFKQILINLDATGDDAKKAAINFVFKQVMAKIDEAKQKNKAFKVNWKGLIGSVSEQLDGKRPLQIVSYVVDAVEPSGTVKMRPLAKDVSSTLFRSVDIDLARLPKRERAQMGVVIHEHLMELFLEAMKKNPTVAQATMAAAVGEAADPYLNPDKTKDPTAQQDVGRFLFTQFGEYKNGKVIFIDGMGDNNGGALVTPNSVTYVDGGFDGVYLVNSKDFMLSMWGGVNHKRKVGGWTLEGVLGVFGIGRKNSLPAGVATGEASFSTNNNDTGTFWTLRLNEALIRAGRPLGEHVKLKMYGGWDSVRLNSHDTSGNNSDYDQIGAYHGIQPLAGHGSRGLRLGAEFVLNLAKEFAVKANAFAGVNSWLDVTNGPGIGKQRLAAEGELEYKHASGKGGARAGVGYVNGGADGNAWLVGGSGEIGDPDGSNVGAGARYGKMTGPDGKQASQWTLGVLGFLKLSAAWRLFATIVHSETPGKQVIGGDPQSVDITTGNPIQDNTWQVGHKTTSGVAGAIWQPVPHWFLKAGYMVYQDCTFLDPKCKIGHGPNVGVTYAPKIKGW